MRELLSAERGPELSRKAYNADIALYGVYEISKLLAQPERLEVTLGQVLNVLSSFLDMRHALIALLNGQGAPDAVVGAGWREDTARRYFEALPEKAIGRIVVTQMPIVVENIVEDPLFEGSQLCAEIKGDETVAFIGVPIRDRDRVIGTLTIDRDLRRPANTHFSLDDDVRFLTMVANLVGPTVRLQKFIARDRDRMLAEQRRLEKALSEQHVGGRNGDQPAGIVGNSPEIRSVLDKVRLVARSHSTVLLRGESGTGKELFARALHELSPRKEKSFVTLNCAALPESVLESELFGHERGAFTGAQGQRKGRFELADGGTLFLDEIGEISPQFQAKLLRVLQLGEFERVGGSSTIKVDVRIVAATNRDLESAVATGEFRADLYYRISVVPIILPPLRNRTSDIPLLAENFLHRFNEANDTQLSLTEPAISVLSSCSFPGNVRELENCICRTATLASGPDIVEDDFACKTDECLSAALWQNKSPGMGFGNGEQLLPAESLDRRSERNGTSGKGRPIGGITLPVQGQPARVAVVPDEPEVVDDVVRPRDRLDEMDEDEGDLTDRERLISVLESVGWVQAKAARVLGLTPRQVGYAVRKHGIPIKKF